MLSEIVYDRSARAYTLPNGESFPAGVTGRRDAQRRAIQLRNDALYTVVLYFAGRHPAAASRLWRAAEIAVAGGVSMFSSRSFAVLSQSSEHGDYQVTVQDGVLLCECDDFAQMGAIIEDRTVCKHTLAVMLHTIAPLQSVA